MRHNVDHLKLEIFKATGLKVGANDPVIQLTAVYLEIMDETIDDFDKKLKYISEAHILQIEQQQKQILENFDTKQDELNQLLSKLDNQKDRIINEVWLKLEERTAEKIHKELSDGMAKIANNANNKINNQRIFLTGAVVGIVTAFLISFVFFIFK